MAAQQQPFSHEYLVIIPCLPDTHAKKVEVYDEHVKQLGPLVDSGFLLAAGGYWKAIPEPGQLGESLGSMVVVNAKSPEEALETLKGDLYYKKQIWDWDRLQIYPFKSAVRQPLKVWIGQE